MNAAGNRGPNGARVSRTARSSDVPATLADRVIGGWMWGRAALAAPELAVVFGVT